MEEYMILDKYKETTIDLYCNGGYSAVGISKLFNVNNKTVMNSLRRWGVEKSDYNLYSKVYIPADALTDLYRSGKTQAEIAAIFNCSRGAVRYRLRKLGIIKNDPNGARFRRKQLPKEMIINLYNSGLSCKEIADKLDVSYSVIYSRLKSWNVKTRNFTESNLVRYERGIVCNISTPRGKGAYYDTPHQGRRWLRSSWETAVADYLNSVGKRWYYEYKCLTLDNGIKYLPDFYLPEENKYIEVKGWKTPESMRKYNLAKNIYNIELWDRVKLFELGIVDKGGYVV